MEQVHHHYLSPDNRADMLAALDKLLFWLDPIGTIPPKAGDIIHFEASAGELVVFIEGVKPLVEMHNKHNWVASIYGDDVGKLRERLTYQVKGSNIRR